MSERRISPRTARNASRYSREIGTPETPAELEAEIEELLTPPEQKTAGRPSSYTQELATEIVTRVSGGETLRDICQDSHMPTTWAIWNWERRFPGFAKAIDLARARQGEAWGELAIQEAMRPHDPDDKVAEMARRTRVDTLLKAAGRRSPERWGDKPQPGAGVNLQIVTNLDMGDSAQSGQLTVEARDPQSDDAD